MGLTINAASGSRVGIVTQLRSSMIIRMFTPGSLRSPGAGMCDARYTGAEGECAENSEYSENADGRG